jgi:hypothetical protein
MKYIGIFFVLFFLFSLSIPVLAQTKSWEDFGLSEESVQYLSDEQKNQILKSLTPQETTELQKQVKEANPQEGSDFVAGPDVVAGNFLTEEESSKIVSCFDYYSFGSVTVDLMSQASTAVAGMDMKFDGIISNTNNYPIVDGNVYVKIFKSRGEEKDANGPDVVDQFIVEQNISIPAQGSVPFSVDWKVPASAVKGDYQVATFFVTDKKFNLSGLSFTDDVVGNTFNFTVDGTETGVFFDKSSVLVNEEPYFFAAYPPRISSDNNAAISVSVQNTTTESQNTQIVWSIYKWDAINPDNLIKTVNTDATIEPSSEKIFNIEISDKEYPVYYVVGELKNRDGKSFVGIRYVRDGVDLVRLNFPSITKFPLVRGEENTIFTCLHNSGTSPVVRDNKMIMELKDDKGNIVESYTYEGPVTGDMMAVKKDFKSLKSLNVFSLHTQLWTNGVLVDESVINYDCKLIDSGQCPSNSIIKILTSLIGGVVLIFLLIFILKKIRNKNSIILPVLVSLFLFGALSTPLTIEAKTLSWTKVETKDFAYFWNRWGNGVYSSGWATALKKPSITIKYNVEIRNAKTNALIESGGSVPVGTEINLKFLKHEYTDISWFGTGYSADSPNGEWRTNATPPTMTTWYDWVQPGNVWTYFEQPVCAQKDFVTNVNSGSVTYGVYIPFVVSPPAKSIMNTNNLSCGSLTGNESTGYTMKCTVTSPGTIQPIFFFGATSGKFYYRYYDPRSGSTGYPPAPLIPGCYGNNIPLETITSYPTQWDGMKTSPYTFTVLALSTSYTLTATAVEPTNKPPLPPTVTGPTTGYVSSPYIFNFVATDPDGDKIKYGIDWNSDTIVDQWLPATLNVNSGVSQSTSKTWSSTSTPATSFKAQTQDEHGALSSWVSYVINLFLPPENGTCGVAQDSCVTGLYTNLDDVGTESRWYCAGKNSGTDSPVCKYDTNVVASFTVSCSAPDVIFPDTTANFVSNTTALSPGYQWKEEDGTPITGAINETFSRNYSVSDVHRVLLSVKQGTETVTESCSVLVKCNDDNFENKPATQCNPVTNTQDVFTCTSSGWSVKNKACIPSTPDPVATFSFDPSVTADSNKKCGLTLSASNVDSCFLTPSSGGNAIEIKGKDGIIEKVKENMVPVGRHILSCTGLGVAPVTKTFGIRSCIVNPEIKEN